MSDVEKEEKDTKQEEAVKQETEGIQEKKEPVEVTILDTELDKLKEEAAEFKSKYMLLLAETDNTRKRMQKERQDLMRYAVQNMIIDLLKPLDSMESALDIAENMSQEVQNWAIGFKMILGQFKDVMSENGVSSFDATGVFDPHSHEAIETVETSEHEAGTILKQFAKGYRMGERTIRPAQVKVAKALKVEEIEAPSGESEEVEQDQNKENKI